MGKRMEEYILARLTGGAWCGDGGRGLEPLSEAEQAMIRELQEEIGVTDYIALEFVANTKDIYPDDLTIYKATYDGEFKTDPAEVEEIKWFPVGEIKRMITQDPAKFHPDVVFFFGRYSGSEFDDF